MEASLLYCSVGCGRTPHAISWSSNGILAFAADKSVALAKEEKVKKMTKKKNNLSISQSILIFLLPMV